MPAGRRTKQYVGIAPIGSNTVNNCKRIVPGNPARRMLLIQNTGSNDGLIRFEEPVQGDGGDMLFAAGAGLLWDRSETCPESAINIGSANGTTFCIIEQIET